ncbi:MAG: hypothetical protein HWE24_20680 [Oceanospirillaceae bacterium]|nr:hypothetical protein [Oceanospirillaceae bacterium]
MGSASGILGIAGFGLARYNPISLFIGALGGGIDGYRNGTRKMEEHDVRVEHLRNTRRD